MNKPYKKTIFVYSDWNPDSSPVLMGKLFAEPIRGKEVFSFAYDANWLKSYARIQLDPQLQYYNGVQYLSDTKLNNFGIFLDSSPDRWGRLLMNRYAKLQNKNVALMESNYLLGVYDANRMGALRFKLDIEGDFLDNNQINASPPWTSLRELENISLLLEDDNAVDNPEYANWLRMLIVPGSSLGGARPKASVVDNHNHPWIAKFPSRYDNSNVGAWEFLVTNLAQQAGIITPKVQLQKFNSKHDTFLSKRFDRLDANTRIHFASAMTLLQHQDGEDANSGVSYLELAEFIQMNGSQPKQDLEQLWRRIVFYICVSNVDDHLRNHGFILDVEHGWRLSPAYDINPVADGNGLKLNIDENDNAQSLELALSVCAYFRLTKDEAKNIINSTIAIVGTWKEEAAKLGISRTEQEDMARAFRVAKI